MPIGRDTQMTIGQAVARLEVLAVQSAEIAREQELLRDFLGTPRAYHMAAHSKPVSVLRTRTNVGTVKERQQVLLKVLEAGPISRRTLVPKTGYPADVIWNDLWRLLSKGLIKRVGIGTYALIGDPAPELKAVKRSPHRNRGSSPDAELRRAILLAVLKNGPMSRKELVEKGGGTKANIANDMTMLTRKGLVARASTGVYELARTNHASE